jgi:glycosyltransferase involved in cell wall biosynthesis
MKLDSSERVLLVAPSPPPYGGMAIQARILENRLRADGVWVMFFASNLEFPPALQWVQGIPGLRTAVRTGLIWARLWGKVRQCDVVHVLAASWVYFFAVVCCAVFYARLQRKRVVINYRGGDARTFFGYYGWLVRPVFSLADVVTVPSEFLQSVIEECLGIRAVIVPNILDGTIFTYRERSCVRPALLVTRHLEPIYDVETAIRAFRIIQDRHPEATLAIAGTGSLERTLRNLVEECALPNVRFLGHIAHRELGPLYDSCDILLNSSRVDNFPGALLEASGAGLAIVSTCAGGIPYVYRHRESAMLAPVGYAEALADAVEAVLQDHTLARSLMENARFAARRCDWAEVRTLLYRAYGFRENRQVGTPAVKKAVSSHTVA